MKTRLLFLLTLLFMLSPRHVLCQENNMRTVFGISVSWQSTPDLLQFIVYQTNGSETINRKFISKKEFLYYASGYRRSIYNPDRINYFALYGIQSYAGLDPVYKDEVLVAGPIDSLWKLRFSFYPYKGNNDKGWSNDYNKPSPSQNAYLLENYQMDLSLGGCVVDTNVWRLLHDIQNSEWVENYRSR
jgi:hypothetical protein